MQLRTLQILNSVLVQAQLQISIRSNYSLFSVLKALKRCHIQLQQYAKASAATRDTGNYNVDLQKAQKDKAWAQQLGRESPVLCLELELGRFT